MAVDMELRPGRGTRALINKTPVSGSRALSALTTSVFFGPDELSLVKGSPDGRRRFLDELVVKLRPARDGLRREWERVLKQRNSLLKSAPRAKGTSLSTLDVWDESLCRVGSALTAARLEVLADLLPFALKRYESIAGGGRLDLDYNSSWIDEEFTEDALRDPSTIAEEPLAEMLKKGIGNLSAARAGARDVVDRPSSATTSACCCKRAVMNRRCWTARVYASQGDQRTSALALKLAEHDLLTERLDDRPLLLLDDVFSELDPERRQWLGDAIRAMGQTLVSSAEPGATEAARAGLVIEVAAGEIVERGAPHG